MTNTWSRATGDLRGLIEAVEVGTATAYDFGLMFPLATNFEHTRAWEAFNGSLDAAKALHDALLSGWVVRHTWGGPITKAAPAEPIPYTHIFKPRMSEDDDPCGVNSAGYRGDNPARAWLLAILRALEAEGKP